MMTQTYININTPVYLSYAWANDEHPNIEKDVDNLCKMLDGNGIFYKCGKKLSSSQSIINLENEIAESKTIIVVLSKRYIQSLNCMHEWHMIRCNGNIEDRVFPILLEDVRNIIDSNVFIQYRTFFENRKNELIKQQEENIIPLTSAEEEAADAGYYIDDLTFMYEYLMEHNCRVNNNYTIIIEQLKAHLRRISDNTSVCNNATNSVPHFTFSIPDGLMHRKNEEEKLFNLVMQKRVVNLIGVGGSGKSSLAYLFLDTRKDNFNEIVYVVVNNNIKDDIVSQLNKALNFEGEEDVYSKIISYLQENYQSAKPNLLVLDINETANKEKNFEIVNEIIKSTAYLDGWKFLIISREIIDTCNRIAIHNLNLNEDFEFMKELFLAKAGERYYDFGDFDGLFNVLYNNPLLTEQLGIYLNGLPKKSLAEIKKIFYSEYFREEDISEGVSVINRHINILSFLEKLIDYNTFKPNAQKLLCHFILWQAEYIDYNVIKNLLKGVFASDDDYENAIVTLYKRDILTQKSFPNGNTSYKLHGLLAESLLEQIDIPEQDYSAYLNNIEEIIEYNYYNFIPYADCIGNSLCEYDIVPDFNYGLLNSVGYKFYDTWKTDYAKRLFEKYIAIAIKKAESNPKNFDYQNDLAGGFMNLANLQTNLLYNYTSAETNYKKSIVISEKTPKNDFDYQYQLALAYNNLANLQQEHLNDYRSAETNYKKAIEILEKLPKNNLENQHWLAIAYHNLALLQGDYLTDYKSAETNYKKAIKIKEQLPKDNPEYQNDLAGTYNNLAYIFKDYYKDYDSAKENYQKAIEIREHLTKDNPEYQNDLANAYNNLAILQKNHLQAYDSAKENYQKAIEIREHLPKDNPEYQNDLANAYNNLAILQEYHLQAYGSAKENYQKAIDIGKQLPKDNPKYQNDLAETYNSFAYLLKDHFKDYPSAKENCNKAIEISKQLSNNNPEKYRIYLLVYKHSLADICFDNNEIEAIKSILDEIKPLAEECLAKNPNDEWTKTVNDGINELLKKINNSESATKKT